jgi:hypothetical protein
MKQQLLVVCEMQAITQHCQKNNNALDLAMKNLNINFYI